MEDSTPDASTMDALAASRHWDLSLLHAPDAHEPVLAVHVAASGRLPDGLLHPFPDETLAELPNLSTFPITPSRIQPPRQPRPPTPPSPSSAPTPPNHWLVFLELPNHRAIKLDMSPGHQVNRPYREGTIRVSSVEAGWMEREGLVKSLAFPVMGDVVVVGVLGMLRVNGRHRYLFSDKGEGSRFWVYTVVGDLEGAEVLEDGQGERTAEAVAMVWGDGDADRDGDDGMNMGTGRDGEGKERERRAVRRGLFTNWTMRGDKKK